MHKRTVGIVDPDAASARRTAQAFGAHGFSAVTLLPREVEASAWGIDALCLELGLQGPADVSFVTRIRGRRPDLPIGILSTDTRVESVVKMMRLGVVDYVTRPALEGRLFELHRRIITSRPLLLGLTRFGRLEEVEARAILLALERAQGDVIAAAKRLGIGRSTLYRRLSIAGWALEDNGKAALPGRGSVKKIT